MSTTAEASVELAQLTREEYRTRVLLQACFRALDAIPDDETTERDRKWRDDMYRSWTAASDALGAFRLRR